MVKTAFMLAATTLLASAANAATRYTITDLGPSFQAAQINDLGWMVGTVSAHATVRTADGTLIDLGDLGAGTSFGYSINNSNMVSGTSAVRGPTGANIGRHAFTWTQAGGMVDIGEPAGGPILADGYAINNLGQVAGTGRSSTADAFYWTEAGGFRLLAGINGSNSGGATDINDAGQIVGGSSVSGGGFRAVRWTLDGTVTDLGDLSGGANSSSATAINQSGQIVGESDGASGRRAFLWTEAEGMRDLGVLAGASIRSSAADINDAGVVVGTAQGSFINPTAMIWSEEFGMRDLHSLTDTGGVWYLLSARSINNNGQIIGAGALNGRGHNFLLTPYEFAGVPEPASWALMIGGFAVAGTQVRRRKTATASA